MFCVEMSWFGTKVATAMLHSTLSGLLGATPVVDIDNTVFVQGGLFVALALTLNALLFKPWLAAQARRYEATDGALIKATELRREAGELAGRYETRIRDARDRAAELRSGARRDEERSQSAKLADTRTAAARELEDTRRRLTADAEEARQALSVRVDELAEEIATKVLGRTPS